MKLIISALVFIILVLTGALIIQWRQITDLRRRQAEELVRQETKLREEFSSSSLDKQTRLSMLQSQINPHFLYNTLECIRSEALIYDCDSIASMSKALASFFRYSISNREDVVSLRDELKNLDNYFMIQAYRFEDKFTYKIDFEEDGDKEELMDCLLPKLTLQPIVENAIFHGLETTTEQGRIEIRIGCTDKHLDIMISDNGSGMSREQLEKLRASVLNGGSEGSSASKKERPASGNGIALSNVAQRLRILFGENSGIKIYSSEGAGTDVEIIVPRITEKKDLISGDKPEIGQGNKAHPEDKT